MSFKELYIVCDELLPKLDYLRHLTAKQSHLHHLGDKLSHFHQLGIDFVFMPVRPTLNFRITKEKQRWRRTVAIYDG